MPRFVTLPFPFVDCAVINFKDSNSASRCVDRLTSALGLHGLAIQWRAIGIPDCVVVLSTDAPIRSVNGHTRIFSGFGKIEGRFIFGNSELPAESSNINCDVGQFTYFDIGPDGVRADNDLFGHGHLFASQHSDCAIISNRLHLQTLVIGALGHALELHGESALSLLFSNDLFFSQQNMSRDMLTKGVVLIGIDKRASLKNGVLDYQRKEVLYHCMSPGSYEQLVNEGVKDIVENVKIVLDKTTFKTVILELSGGKDSRMVFGAAMHYPDWQARVKLQTREVPGSEDLPIACGIANMFGAHFYGGSTIRQDPLSAEQSLNLWRSYFHGLYHRVAATAWTNSGRNTEALTLGGGNGEIYRTFWHANLRKYTLAGDTVVTFAERIARNAGLWEVFNRDNETAIASYIQNSVDQLPGVDLRSKLEAHYLFFRNRSHFGLRGFSFYHEMPTWFPLMSGSLLRAVHSLPFEQRVSGRLVYDVLQKLHPILANIRFDGQIRGDTLLRAASLKQRASDQFVDDVKQKLSAILSTKAIPCEIALNVERGNWEKATKAAEELNKANRQGLKQTMLWSQWNSFVIDSAIKAHEEAKLVSSTYRDIVDDRYIDLLRTEYKLRPKMALGMASRLLAIHDSLITS
jgi:hypothetical protein